MDAEGRVILHDGYWEPRPDRFELVPVYADGSRGVPANLRSLFEAYDAATEGEDE